MLLAHAYTLLFKITVLYSTTSASIFLLGGKKAWASAQVSDSYPYTDTK